MNSLVTKLESFDFDQLLNWLANALSGEVSLPGRVSPDETPSVTLRSLLVKFQGHPVLIHNLEDACRELLSRFATAPSWSDSHYESELLMLADFLSLPDAAPRLTRLVKNAARFRSLPSVARRIVLQTLHDLPGTLVPSLWKEAAAIDPVMLGPIAFSALLKRDLVSDALAVLHSFPDDSQVAASLPTFLRLSSAKLSDLAKEGLVSSLRRELLLAKPQIKAAVGKWLETQPFLEAVVIVPTPVRSTYFDDYLENESVRFNVPPARCALLGSYFALC